MKKRIILITLLIILLCSVLFIISLKLFYGNDFNNDIELGVDSDDNEIQKVIAEVNNINKLFENIDINDPTKYVIDEKTCYSYKGNDIEENINRLNQLYISPFFENSYFNFSTSNKDESLYQNLYLCIPFDCNVLSIDEYDILSEESDRKIIRIDNSEYIIKKDNNKWKFIFPIVICE